MRSELKIQAVNRQNRTEVCRHDAAVQSSDIFLFFGGWGVGLEVEESWIGEQDWGSLETSVVICFGCF